MTESPEHKKPMAPKSKPERSETSRRVGQMLGLDLDSWNNLMLSFLFIAAVFGVLAAIATYCVVRLQDQDAQASAERVASLELQAEQLRKSAGPRGINQERFVKALGGKPKLPVQIWYLPNESDSLLLATRLIGALVAANWQLVEPPTPVPESRPDPKDIYARFMPPLAALGAQQSGVSVVMHGVPADIEKPHPELDALVRAIADGLEAHAYGGFSTSVPEGILRVIIAAKPDPLLPPVTSANTGESKKK